MNLIIHLFKVKILINIFFDFEMKLNHFLFNIYYFLQIYKQLIDNKIYYLKLHITRILLMENS